MRCIEDKLSTVRRNNILYFLFACIAMTGMLCACNSKEVSDKLRDLEYTVVGVDEQPQALKQVIEEKGVEPYQISFCNGDGLYIAVGYGQQESGGYSITVDELYESEDSICVDTTLLGPEGEQVKTMPTCPYIVIKTENIENKQIEFK